MVGMELYSLYSRKSFHSLLKDGHDETKFVLSSMGIAHLSWVYGFVWWPVSQGWRQKFSDRGVIVSDREAVAPLALPWRHHCNHYTAVSAARKWSGNGHLVALVADAVSSSPSRLA